MLIHKGVVHHTVVYYEANEVYWLGRIPTTYFEDKKEVPEHMYALILLSSWIDM